MLLEDARFVKQGVVPIVGLARDGRTFFFMPTYVATLFFQ